MNEKDLIQSFERALNDYFGDTFIEVNYDYDNPNVCHLDTMEYDASEIRNKFKITVERE